MGLYLQRKPSLNKAGGAHFYKENPSPDESFKFQRILALWGLQMKKQLIFWLGGDITSVRKARTLCFPSTKNILGLGGCGEEKENVHYYSLRQYDILISFLCIFLGIFHQNPLKYGKQMVDRNRNVSTVNFEITISFWNIRRSFNTFNIWIFLMLRILWNMVNRFYYFKPDTTRVSLAHQMLEKY